MQRAIIQHGFLGPKFFRLLDENFPPPPSRGVRMHRDINSRSPEFSALHPVWGDLHELIHSIDFWSPLVEALHLDGLVDWALWDPEAHEGKGGPEIPTDPVMYARMDLGWGGINYGVKTGGRGPHIDNWPRLISGLLYFTDQSEMEGGEFELLSAPPTQSVVQSVPIRKNMAIISVQDQEGWHRVRPVKAFKNGAEWRRAVYFALSDSRDLFGRSKR